MKASKQILLFCVLLLIIGMCGVVFADDICPACQSDDINQLADYATPWYLHHICYDPGHYTVNVTKCEVWYKDTYENFACNEDDCYYTWGVVINTEIDHVEVPD